jgi:uncharacterized protein YndB with AHSA1/START domain
METLSVTRTVLIAASPERVWAAVTEPAQLERWYAPGCRWEIPSLEAGALVRFFNTPTDIQVATIVRLERGRELTLRWQADPAQPTVDIITSFRLELAEGGTRVTIYEAGYETLPGNVGPALAKQAEAGYATSLAALQAHLQEVPA